MHRSSIMLTDGLKGWVPIVTWVSEVGGLYEELTNAPGFIVQLSVDFE